MVTELNKIKPTETIANQPTGEKMLNMSISDTTSSAWRKNTLRRIVARRWTIDNFKTVSRVNKSLLLFKEPHLFISHHADEPV